ncbi:alpha/beta-hydrolase [Durotheca rogersii]|uniref:alpha/beta-hydrolase n=1 Tax=Durotheca rogersii TaxID=419775 RepID=UPI002220EA20|nr:alpha/beta-hydrolase [Durotheca rogersii]KAI5859596.1 alpha/beta-hydrolase [Durotheca rogersii]
MASPWPAQPFKAIYIALFLLKTPPHLALLSLRYMFKSLRPVPGWTFRTSLGIALFRAQVRLFTKIRYQRAPQLKPGKAGERFVLISPPDSCFFQGVLASRTVQPAPVGALWFPGPAERNEKGMVERGQKTVIHFAGGGFVLGWNPNKMGRSVADVLMPHLDATNILYVQYRLATEETPFPAALQDALTAYYYVLNIGVDPEDIILSGDSAGANLILGLLRYLEMFPSLLPLPSSAMLWSPWVKVTANDGREYYGLPNSRVDFLVPSVLDWGARAYIPEGDLSQEDEAFICPLYHSFRSSTPLFIQAGTKEAYYDAMKRFADDMAAIKGNRVKFHQSHLAPHDIFFTCSMVGFKKEVGLAIEEALDFLTPESLGHKEWDDC